MTRSVKRTVLASEQDFDLIPEGKEELRRQRGRSRRAGAMIVELIAAGRAMARRDAGAEAAFAQTAREAVAFLKGEGYGEG